MVRLHMHSGGYHPLVQLRNERVQVKPFLLGENMRFIDLTGQRFGRLTVSHRVLDHKRKRAMWSCVCDCGGSSITGSDSLRLGLAQSCGCYRKEQALIASTKHGCKSRNGETKAYKSWCDMIRRCHSLTSKDNKNYGGRGIFVCNQWRESFSNFLADMGDPPQGMTLDRRNNNLGYSKENCRWATDFEQANNARSNWVVKVSGKEMTVSEFSESIGANHRTIRAYIGRGIRTIKGVTFEASKRGENNGN